MRSWCTTGSSSSRWGIPAWKPSSARRRSPPGAAGCARQTGSGRRGDHAHVRVAPRCARAARGRPPAARGRSRPARTSSSAGSTTRGSSTTARGSTPACSRSAARAAGPRRGTDSPGIRARTRCSPRSRRRPRSIRPGSRPRSTAAASSPSGSRSNAPTTAFARLPQLEGGERVVRAMRANPDLLRGPVALDVQLIRSLDGWFAKGGAEGLLCAASRRRTRGRPQGRGRLVPGSRTCGGARARAAWRRGRGSRWPRGDQQPRRTRGRIARCP